jgi:hypothetical protein
MTCQAPSLGPALVDVVVDAVLVSLADSVIATPSRLRELVADSSGGAMRQPAVSVRRRFGDAEPTAMARSGSGRRWLIPTCLGSLVRHESGSRTTMRSGRSGSCASNITSPTSALRSGRSSCSSSRWLIVETCGTRTRSGVGRSCVPLDVGFAVAKCVVAQVDAWIGSQP